MVLQLAGQPIGYVECKDVRVALDVVENSPQLKRYRNACDNLILTNYREFRWYRGGESTGQSIAVAAPHYWRAVAATRTVQRTAHAA